MHSITIRAQACAHTSSRFPTAKRIEIMARPEVTEPAAEQMRAGYIHLSIAVGSRQAVEGKTRELGAAGYACISGPRVTGDGYYESCIVGPEGILIEITV